MYIIFSQCVCKIIVTAHLQNLIKGLCTHAISLTQPINNEIHTMHLKIGATLSQIAHPNGAWTSCCVIVRLKRTR